jgi:regulatory protein
VGADRVTEVVREIRPSRRRRKRIDVILAGGRVLELAARLASRLRVGQTLTPSQLEALGAEDEVDTAHDRALRLLARRPRSERELRDDMRRRRLPERTQAAVLQRLAEAGLIDDAAFAAAWVENRQAFRPRSATGLRAELRRKGIGRETVEAALGGHDEAAAAQKALERAARRWPNESWDEFRRRATDYLARRGFDYEIVTRVVRAAWREAARLESEDSS